MAETEEKDTCSICLDELDMEGGELIKLPMCKHVFHTKCFFDVMTSNGSRAVACPLCRDCAVNLPLPAPVMIEAPPRIVVVTEEGDRGRRRLDDYLKNVLMVLTFGTLWYLVFGLLDH